MRKILKILWTIIKKVAVFLFQLIVVIPMKAHYVSKTYDIDLVKINKD